MSIIFLLLLLSSCTFSVLSAVDDGLALLKIKEQLDTDILSSWVEGFNFCNGSANVEHYFYIDCTSTGRVRSLGFNYFPVFSAPFPEAICDLTELEILSIHRVYGMEGPVPSCINKLVNLQTFYMYKTNLGGTIPEFLNHKNLTKIYLSFNALDGPIPPSLAAIPNLETLDLSWNGIKGTIPPALLHNPPASLYLNENWLSGELPRCYGSVNFGRIDVSDNNLHGDASFLFGKQKTVTYINLSFNNFAFDLSNVEIPENLTHLDLSFNSIYGNVPESLNRHPMLDHLDLIFNNLCGEIPQGGNISLYSSGPFGANRCLCGSPLPPCSSPAPAPAP